MTGLVLLLVGVAVLLVAAASVRTVPAGHVGVVGRRGGGVRTAQPGVVVVLPLRERLVRRVDLRERTLELTDEPIVAADHLVHRLDVRVRWSVRDAVAATSEVADVDLAVRDLVRATARQAVGALPSDQVAGHEAWVGRQLHQVVGQAVLIWGLEVARVEVARAGAR